MKKIKFFAVFLFFVIGVCYGKSTDTSTVIAKDDPQINGKPATDANNTEINLSLPPEPTISSSTTAPPSSNSTTTTKSTPSNVTTVTPPSPTTSNATTTSIPPTPPTTSNTPTSTSPKTPITTSLSTSTTSSSTTKSTAAPTTTPDPPHHQSRKFDGPSFVGGIILALGLVGIGFVALKFYKARAANYHPL